LLQVREPGVAQVQGLQRAEQVLVQGLQHVVLELPGQPHVVLGPGPQPSEP
jgi:hypothetical protein